MYYSEDEVAAKIMKFKAKRASATVGVVAGNIGVALSLLPIIVKVIISSDQGHGSSLITSFAGGTVTAVLGMMLFIACGYRATYSKKLRKWQERQEILGYSSDTP